MCLAYTPSYAMVTLVLVETKFFPFASDIGQAVKKPREKKKDGGKRRRQTTEAREMTQEADRLVPNKRFCRAHSPIACNDRVLICTQTPTIRTSPSLTGLSCDTRRHFMSWLDGDDRACVYLTSRAWREAVVDYLRRAEAVVLPAPVALVVVEKRLSTHTRLARELVYRHPSSHARVALWCHWATALAPLAEFFANDRLIDQREKRQRAFLHGRIVSNDYVTTVARARSYRLTPTSLQPTSRRYASWEQHPCHWRA